MHLLISTCMLRMIKKRLMHYLLKSNQTNHLLVQIKTQCRQILSPSNPLNFNALIRET
jgi:hypothetical protein